MGGLVLAIYLNPEGAGQPEPVVRVRLLRPHRRPTNADFELVGCVGVAGTRPGGPSSLGGSEGKENRRPRKAAKNTNPNPTRLVKSNTSII